MDQKPLVSVIIPTYNEQESIKSCVRSLKKQTDVDIEIIVVDDGSQDKTRDIVKQYSVTLLVQDHHGPGPARNLGASKSNGSILVFVDADMTFSKDFIKDLVRPIIKGETIGTFSKNEFVANKNNVWSTCWNINRNFPKDKMHPSDYPDTAPVFRAILKKEFDKVNGFDTSGEYTDDWSLYRKLKTKSTLASGAVYYHSNPQTLREVYSQARWIGKNEFISGNLPRRIKSLAIYNPITSALVSIIKSASSTNPSFLVFKPIYDFAILQSIISSFFSNSNKFK